MPGGMEDRVAKMESEMRVLRAAIARVPQSILRELAARGALLVVKAPSAELEEVVGKEILPVGEMEGGEEGAAVVAGESGGGADSVAIVPGDEVEGGGAMEEKPWAMDAALMQDVPVEEKGEGSSACSSDADDGSSDSSDEETVTRENHQHTSVETSQESASSGTRQQSPLSLRAFDEAVATPPQPTPAVAQRPRLPFAMEPSSALHLRPLVLARRAVVTPPRSRFSPVAHTQQATAGNLPADFEVQTKDTVGVAWGKWCCGDAALGLPPFRHITSKHVTNKPALRRLSDLRCAMLPIETLAKERGLWRESLTPEGAAVVYEELAPLLPLSQELPSGRKRTREIAWPTALNIMRRRNKRKQPATGATATSGYASETLI